MGQASRATGRTPVADTVRRRVRQGGERLWRIADFRGASFSAVAQALSRLTRAGELRRLSKGVYYRSRSTAFGPSTPNPADIRRLAEQERTVFPAGVPAANLLGFTTQTSARSEVATSGLSLPRKLVGGDTVVYTRRPATWDRLSAREAALLDFLRRGARTSELPPEETERRTLALFAEPGRFERLVRVAPQEPPRVRAILGAIGEQIGKKRVVLDRLHASLNPLSRFDFGLLAGLTSARRWHAKERKA
jgi:hypothetical protein